jgi:hypothetical protein
MIYYDLFTTYGGIPQTFHISSSFSHQNCAALPQSVGSSDGHMERRFSLRGNGCAEQCAREILDANTRPVLHGGPP